MRNKFGSNNSHHNEKSVYFPSKSLDTRESAHIISQIRRFADSQIRRFADSQIRRFADSQIRRFADSFRANSAKID
ncbi:MAG: hypothetical protein IJ530_08500 [Treponema sp.]|uniref:hypothetical protein n=1 Tax=Treponema sp. TaxID=166 RepID=UPI0025F3C2BC|nr:hypothetical protein [Treponema sp.]MBQ8679792.1 hypothetical protein [Treponema sp.]